MKSLLSVFLGGWGKWVAIGLAVAGLLWAVDHYRGAAELASVKLEQITTENKRMVEERKVLVDNQKAWAEAAKKIDALAGETAAARADEHATLTGIAASLAKTKEGIRNAPGADDSFVFSGPAYDFMRQQPEAEPVNPAGVTAK